MPGLLRVAEDRSLDTPDAVAGKLQITEFLGIRTRRQADQRYPRAVKMDSRHGGKARHGGARI